MSRRSPACLASCQYDRVSTSNISRLGTTEPASRNHELIIRPTSPGRKVHLVIGGLGGPDHRLLDLEAAVDLQLAHDVGNVRLDGAAGQE